MDGLIGGYNGEKMSDTIALTPRRFTVTDRLKAQQRDLSERLAEVNKTLAVLEANPEICEVVDQLSRLGHF